jgi:hypothetical protein
MGESTFTDIRLAVFQAQPDEWAGFSALVVLDGLESIQNPDGFFDDEGVDLDGFLHWCSDGTSSIYALLASKQEIPALQQHTEDDRSGHITIGAMPPESALRMLADMGIQGDLRSLYHSCRGIAQDLQTSAGVIRDFFGGNADDAKDCLDMPFVKAVREWYVPRLREQDEWSLTVLQAMALLKHVPLTNDMLFGLKRLHSSDGSDHTMAGSLKCLSPCLRYHLLLPLPDRKGWRFPHEQYREVFMGLLPPEEERDLRASIAEYLNGMLQLPVTPATRTDLLVAQELIDQLCHLGRVHDAYTVYREKLSAPAAADRHEGPFDRLTRLNAPSSGRAITRIILRASEPHAGATQSLLPWERAWLMNDGAGFARALGLLHESEEMYEQALETTETPLAALRLNRSFALRNPPRTYLLRGYLEQALQAAETAHQHESTVGDSEGVQITLCLQAQARAAMGQVPQALDLWEEAVNVENGIPDRLSDTQLRERIFEKGYSIHWAYALLRSGRASAGGASPAERSTDVDYLLRETRRLVAQFGENDYVDLQCALLQVHRSVDPRDVTEWETALQQLLSEVTRMRRTDLVVWTQLSTARFALAALHHALDREQVRHLLERAQEAVSSGIELAELRGFGLYWIDLQIVRGELALLQAQLNGTDTRARVVDEAYTAARLALYGKPLAVSPEEDGYTEDPERLEMLGACHAVCGYRWGRVDGLELLIRCHALGAPVASGVGTTNPLRQEEEALRSQLQPNPDTVPPALWCLHWFPQEVT